MEKESFTDLINQAKEMFKDRTKKEADLIFSVAKLDREAQAAIIMAYELLYKS